MRGPNGANTIDIAEVTNTTKPKNRVQILDPSFKLDQFTDSARPTSQLTLNPHELRSNMLPKTSVAQDKFILPSASDQNVFKAPMQIPARKQEHKKLDLEFLRLPE